jgi:hypothetical protein
MRKIQALTLAAVLAASFAITPAASARPPESKTPAYQVDCGDGTMDLYVIGATRLWDAEGNGYLIRSAEQSVEIEGTVYGPFARSWGRGASSPGAITCTGGGFDLQGFWITDIELTIVPLP